MGFKHLTINERESILKFQSQGKSISDIALILERNKSTISREFKRNSINAYSPSAAHNKYIQSKKKCGRKLILLLNDKLNKHITEMISKEEHSPEEIEGALKLDNKPCVSFKTIYNGIYRGIIKIDVKKSLRRRGKPYKKSIEKRGKIPDRIMIDQRPTEINNRESIGHYESDTIVGAHHKSAISTYVDRYSRFLVIGKMRDRTADSLVKSTVEGFRNIPLEKIKSFTSDNGQEFSKFKELEKTFEIKQYFAFPRHPWERGTNENTNGLIRQYFPKGTDFNKVSVEELMHVQNKLNNRPRKCLGFRTPMQVFWETVAFKLAI